jgi:hypothetical protein
LQSPEEVLAPGSGPPVRIAALRSAGPIAALLVLRQRFVRFEPALFFTGGVTWDALTLQRIDEVFDNVFLLTYLLGLGALLVVAMMVEAGVTRRALLVRYRTWYPAAVQFLMGALLSAYVVFYLQSASLTRTSIFLILLVGLLVANEFIYRRIFNLYLLFALYYFASFSFFVFLLPVLTKTMSYGTFIGAGVLSGGLVGGMLYFLWYRGVFARSHQFAYALGLIAAIFALLNLFYLRDWMPPVPLAMRHAGIYHHVEREQGAYQLHFEKPPWYAVWAKDNRRFRFAEGDAVHCFAAVFAPAQLKKGIYHEWSFFDETAGKWVETDRMDYQIEGLRDSGYRWYSRKRHVHPGRWRVDIRTDDGRTLGRVRFTIEAVEGGARTMTMMRYE